jgi:hypothetical protein
MARSVWKGPFVEESLMKKVDKYKDDPKKIPIKTWSRKSTILPDFVGVSFKFIMGKNLFRLLYRKIWLDISWVNLLQLELFMVIHLLTRKQNQLRRLKNNYE